METKMTRKSLADKKVAKNSLSTGVVISDTQTVAEYLHSSTTRTAIYIILRA